MRRGICSSRLSQLSSRVAHFGNEAFDCRYSGLAQSSCVGQVRGICFLILLLGYLDLGHGRTSTSSAERASEVDAAASGVHKCEEQADGPQSPVEPKEGGGSLFFSTATSSVVCAIGKVVVEGVPLKKAVSKKRRECIKG